MFNVFAQISIGGNVYGGGNAGDTGGSTTVTVRAGDIDAVYGGARMANVGGSTFVNIDGAHASEDILIATVYGGNDISGTIGEGNVQTTVPTELENIKKTDADATDKTKNAIDNSWKTFIRTSPCGEEHSATIGGTTVSADKYMVVIGTLYGAGNGDYVYKDGSGNNLTDGNGNFIVQDASGTTVATSKSAFSKPELAKTYLELKGGCIAHVYGGGNAATVTGNTTINIDNSSDDLQKAVSVWRAVKHPEESMADVFEYLKSRISISDTQSDLSSYAFNFARVFGGNNKADMAIRPKWNLQKGIIRDLYGGGNEGRMTSHEGLLLQIEGAGMTVQNVYGGCRKADVRPLYNNNDETPVPDDKIELDPNDNPNNIPPGYAARVRVLGGHVTNVYGGNDISGNVYGGNTVGILTRIYGNVYGGGNGSYAYTDNPKLKDDPDWRDYYYDPDKVLQDAGVTATSDELKSAEALNIFRPNAEKVSILVRGTEDKPVTVDGALYVGGNSASLRKQTATRSGNNEQTHIKIGSYVTIDNVFLGNNGENMVKYNEANATLGINEGVLRTLIRTDIASDHSKFNSMDLTDKDVFAKYMEGCAMKVNPTVVFDADYVPYSTKFGSLFCGGNVGSIIVPGKITVDFKDKVIIYEKVVGGCNNANVNAQTGFNAEYQGGMLGESDVPEGSPAGTIGDKLELNFAGLKMQPMRWNEGHTALIWNTVSAATGNNVDPVITGATPESPVTSNDADKDRRLMGGNVYGGCYNTGHVNGNVIINIDQTLVDRTGEYAVFDETTEKVDGEPVVDENGRYTITQRHSGVVIDIQGDDVLGKALNVFGGGYGPESEIWGSTTINVNGGYAFQVFGGGEQGPVGKSDSNGSYTYNYKIGNEARSKKYSYDSRYSCYVNLKGNDPGTFRNDKDLNNNNNDNVIDNPNMAEVEYLYGGAFEAPIAGNTVVSLGNGRIYQSFGGSCNADILGHTETYVGRQVKSDGTYTDGNGFPWVRDNTYGGNDMGGRILNSADFKSRVSTDVLEKVHGYSQTNTTSDVLQAAAYTEFIQGRVKNIFGGAYGVYDYTDRHFKDYTEADGRVKGDFSKPFADNAFINFKPNSNTRNAVTKVYGGPEGSEGEIDKDLMQQRSYVLIDAPDVSNFQNMEVYGAGSFGGLGMNKTKAEAKADLDKVSAIIDLMRGKIANVYGGSRNQGMTRRTLVNVPAAPAGSAAGTKGSTINVANIFGGAYGSDPLIPCDVYEAIVNYNSEDATVRGNIYGGNNSADRTLYGKVNVSVPVWQSKADRLLAKVYGAGYGTDTWSQYTEVNLTDRAQVYEVYGGGENGQVLNLATLAKWKEADPDLDLTIGSDYEDYGLNGFPENDPDAYLVKTNGLGEKTNTNVYIGKGTYVAGYAYGGGYGADAIVSGTTYIGLHGGTVNKDIYAAGWGGPVYDKLEAKNFTATTNAYIEGGTVRNCYGGGYEGNVGYTEMQTQTVGGKEVTSIKKDIPAVANVVLGIRKDQATLPADYGFYKGVPAIQRNAYGGGEGGSVIGTANLTINNCYIGYTYNDASEAYEPKLDDETWKVESERAGRLKDCGNAFGAGYDDKSTVDFTNITMWGGIIRSSIYGGGEIATVGRGKTTILFGLDRGLEAIYKYGKTHIEMYNGHVMRNVFGGGKGYNILGYGGTNELYTDGYVFGQTEVHIHGGEIGTVEGVADGYGNVFGAGDVGFVYGKGYFSTKTNTDKAAGITTGSPNHYYYYDDEGNLTEDCKVVVAPELQAKSATTINGKNYAAYAYVLTDDLNTLHKKNEDGTWPGEWNALDTGTEGNERGIVIHNAVFAGGNVSSNSDKTYADATTVYGNTTATLYDVFHRDFITIGTEHTGGLYGGGNLSVVDGYRELNITNYGTDYYGLKSRIELEEYRTLSNRERAYFQLEYVRTADNDIIIDGTTYKKGDRLTEEKYLKAIEKGLTSADEWEPFGFCSIYAGRLLNTIQRADLCGVYGSRMVLQGAKDRVADVGENIDYTINRVGEVSLNQQRSVIPEDLVLKPGAAEGSEDYQDIDNALHGNYFGIYSLVNYMGNLTSDVHFSDDYLDGNGENVWVDNAGNVVDYKEATEEEKENLKKLTYFSYKAANPTSSTRNKGISFNQVALASGVFLELITEKSTKEEKDYGYITGVVELDLINVKQDLVGGGFVYAKNEHRVPIVYPNKKNVILSDYNKKVDNEAVTYKRLRYSADQEGDWTGENAVGSYTIGTGTAYEVVPYETSGNFIHHTKRIVDDCYPTNNAYVIGSENYSEAHYWYVKGDVYIYDQKVSAYTGSANAYSKEVHLPLTITAASHGELKLLNVKPNLYAYKAPSKDADNHDILVKIGSNGTDGNPIEKVFVNNESESYELNDVITWWDWNNLKYAEKQYFVTETYVNCVTVTVKEGNADAVEYAPGTYVMDETDFTTFKNGFTSGTITVKDADNETVTDVSDVFRSSNNISHDTGYVLTFDMDSPSVWNDYYISATGSTKISKAEYEELLAAATTDDAKQEVVDAWREGPTFTPGKAGDYGKRTYEVGDVMTLESFESTGSDAGVDEAYVATSQVTYTYSYEDPETQETKTVTKTVNPGTAIPKKEWNALTTSEQSSFGLAYLCTGTVKLAKDVYLLYGDLKTAEEIQTLKDTYASVRDNEGNIVRDNEGHITYTSLATDIDDAMKSAYICTKKGSYGGQYYDLGKNYGAITGWCSLSKADRDKGQFTFNYDAFDLLIDPDYLATQTTEEAYHQPYSDQVKVEYQAVFQPEAYGKDHKDGNNNPITTLNYDGGTLSSTNTTISNDIFETKIRNDKRHYTKVSVKAGGEDIYFATSNFIYNGTPYGKGQIIDEDTYQANTDDNHTKVEKVHFGTESSPATILYYCYEDYDNVTKGTTITDDAYAQLTNDQQYFVVQGKEPTETTTLYVSRESNAYDVMKEKVITVVYQYTYYEDEDNGNIKLTNELHVINVHLQLESGAPTVGILNPPATVLPGTMIGLKAPDVAPGLYEILANGWELFTTPDDAEHHRNGVPFTNNNTPVYWYQNQKNWVAFYSKTYLGKTYSNPVPLSVANYHDIDEVMQDKDHHMYVDRSDVDRPSKIYIDNRECKSDATKSELDLLKDFFDLSLITTNTEGMTFDENGAISNESHKLKGHSLLNDRVRGGNKLEFFLNSDVSPKAYAATTATPAGTGWVSIGDDNNCFQGNFHGDGYTISGLDHSLFGKLCGSVYNLGVTGSFTSAGVVDTGEGYVENCWIKTSATTASETKVKAVYGNPERNDNQGNIQVVNCYYSAENEGIFSNAADATHGNAKMMPAEAFYNGTVAYNLNGFYLNKRYYDHNVPSGSPTEYKYLKDENGTLSEDFMTGFYPESPSAQYGDVGYVEDRYANEDFIYASGTVPETIDVRQRTVSTTGGTSEIRYAPIWPDDYIFFGQMLTYGHDGYDENGLSGHEDLPSHIVKSSGRLPQNDQSNRVYRAPAYFRSKVMDVAHFNSRAYLAAYSAPKSIEDKNLKSAYPNMTAIDFAGHNDNTYTQGFNGNLFYQPLLDDDGLLSIENKGETPNLLVYAPDATTNEKTYNVLNAYFLDPTYADYTESSYNDGNNYGRVAVANTSSILGHLVQSNRKTNTDHLLVDKQDFNCPIAYDMGTGYRMWYQRTPDNFVTTSWSNDATPTRTTKGWESISLPFTAELVTTHQKGELTHFYEGSTTGHEYWLRRYTGLQTGDPATANFTYPDAGSNEMNYANTFLWDYYYSKDSYRDYNEDEYKKQYYSSEYLSGIYPVSNYPYSQVGTPYLIGFPGSTYYEFDLSGEWTPANRYRDVTIASPGKQIITFASKVSTGNEALTIAVSDDELLSGAVDNSTGYYFKPNYLNIDVPVDGYVMASDGGSYDKVTSSTSAADKKLYAFRTYFSTSAEPQKAARRIMFNNNSSQLGGGEKEGPQDDVVQSMEFFAKKHKIVVTSHMRDVADVGIYSVSGVCIASFDIQPDETIETPIYNSGVYIIRAAGGHYTKKVTIK